MLPRPLKGRTERMLGDSISLDRSGASSKVGRSQGGTTMFAVITSGGKQYRVEEGDVLKVEKLVGEAGDKFNLTPLFISGGGASKTGVLTGAEAAKFVVSAEVVDHGKHKKIYIRKYKSGIQYRKRTGHRQQFTAIKIVGIKG
jgi:large subunit ribosomal protein L21